jgi:hypothetical protein
MNRLACKVFQAVCNGRSAALIALFGFVLLFAASGAKAGCAIPFGKAAAAPPIPFLAPHNSDDWDGPATIVGLWHLNYTATFAAGPFPPVPFPFLESYKTWHADGTEFENAFLPPTGGNICFGVWKEARDGSFKLHHVGLMFDPKTGSVSNVFTVDEINWVSRDGKSYSGSFDFKLFPPTDVYGTGTPLAEVKGTTLGTRIMVPKS